MHRIEVAQNKNLDAVAQSVEESKTAAAQSVEESKTAQRAIKSIRHSKTVVETYLNFWPIVDKTPDTLEFPG